MSWYANGMGIPMIPQSGGTPVVCTGWGFADKAELQTAVDLWVSNRNSAIAIYGQINTWCT